LAQRLNSGVIGQRSTVNWAWSNGIDTGELSRF